MKIKVNVNRNEDGKVVIINAMTAKYNSCAGGAYYSVYYAIGSETVYVANAGMSSLAPSPIELLDRSTKKSVRVPEGTPNAKQHSCDGETWRAIDVYKTHRELLLEALSQIVLED